MFARILTLAIAMTFTAGPAPVRANPIGPAWEGSWYVSDTTDNNTGEREVYAFQTLIDKTDYVSLKMRCFASKPTIWVEWDDQSFPDQTVVTISVSADANSDPEERQYVLENSRSAVDRGLRASPETSAKIVAEIGNARYATVTGFPVSGRRTVGMEINGTQRAWARVARHCPVKRSPRPPM